MEELWIIKEARFTCSKTLEGTAGYVGHFPATAEDFGLLLGRSLPFGVKQKAA